jgi:chromosome segregation ATPase
MNPQELKIKELENKVRLLEEKSFQNSQKLEEIRINKEANKTKNNNVNVNLSNLNNLNTSNNNIKNMNMTSVSYLPDAEVEKIKQEANIMKSDNIIFREDINRLTDINNHLENELIEQRNRNIELANQNEQISQEKSKLEQALKEAKEIIDKNNIGEKNLENFYNEKLILQNKMRDNENELRKAMEEKNKYEIDFKVLQEKFSELNEKYKKINDEYTNNKKSHDEEVNKIEDKIDKLMREIERLQSENNGLRQDNERQRIEISSIGSQRDNYREKYEEQKNKNDLLSGKIADIENDFRNLMKEKEFQKMNRFKQDEFKRNKSETKTKIINELQERIQNYRNQRMKKNKDEEEEY